MITRDYFSHTIPGYGKVWDKLHAIGYCYKVGGENIGWNNYPDDIATATIHADVHGLGRPSGEHPGQAWDHIGVGAYKGPDGKKMWTVLFAIKCGSSSPAPKPTAKPKPKPTSRRRRVDPASDPSAGAQGAQARGDAETDARPRPRSRRS